jgi:hypothetical protein
MSALLKLLESMLDPRLKKNMGVIMADLKIEDATFDNLFVPILNDYSVSVPVNQYITDLSPEAKAAWLELYDLMQEPSLLTSNCALIKEIQQASLTNGISESFTAFKVKNYVKIFIKSFYKEFKQNSPYPGLSFASFFNDINLSVVQPQNKRRAEDTTSSKEIKNSLQGEVNLEVNKHARQLPLPVPSVMPEQSERQNNIVLPKIMLKEDDLHHKLPSIELSQPNPESTLDKQTINVQPQLNTLPSEPKAIYFFKTPPVDITQQLIYEASYYFNQRDYQTALKINKQALVYPRVQQNDYLELMKQRSYILKAIAAASLKEAEDCDVYVRHSSSKPQ